ncbi:MAG: hypothetical protein HQK96_07125 [Nitrospirae bacterium]|nr:hypothetical protein [Nitrospirota bacterium]
MSGRLMYRPFKSLKNIPEQEKEIPAPVLTDIDYFLTAMERVKEIKEFREIPYCPSAVTIPARKPSNDCQAVEAQKTLTEIVTGKSPVEIRNTQEYV